MDRDTVSTVQSRFSYSSWLKKRGKKLTTYITTWHSTEEQEHSHVKVIETDTVRVIKIDDWSSVELP